MSVITDVVARLRSVVLRGREEREMEEELALHRALDVERNVARGMTRREAERAAVHAFGAWDGVREEVRDARGVRPLDDLRSDLRHAARMLWRTPSFSIVVLATLALGIGATSAIFTVIDGVLLRPAPYEGMDDLVVVWETDRASGTIHEPGSYPDYLDFTDRSRTLVALELLHGASVDYLPTDAGDPTRLSGLATTHGFAALLGIEPILGRTFTAAEDRPGAARVVLLGEGFWRERLGGDPAVIGSTVRLNGEPHEVIGVMPSRAGFGVPQIHARAAYHAPYSGDEAVDVWLPLRPDATESPRETHPFLMLGRLAPGASLAQAQQEVAAIAADLEAVYPENDERGANLEPLGDVVFAGVRPALVLLGGAVVLVLLIACANVTSLLLARSRVRARETAVRTALGAGSARLARQFLTENLLLAALGAGAGLLLARVGLDVLIGMIPLDVPRAALLTLDERVLSVSLVLALLIGALFALVPLLHGRRAPLQQRLRDEPGRSATTSADSARFRSGLVVAELALSVMLAAGAVLLIRSFDQLRSVDPGFSAAGVLKVEYQLPESRYPRDFAVWPDWREVHAFNAAVLASLHALPGVDAAALAEAHPLDPGLTNSFVVVGREAEAENWPEITIRKVSPGYFETVQLQVVRGRPLTDADRIDSDPVVVINAAAAERFFAGREPIGAQLSFWGTPRTIVGVVGDERLHGLDDATPPAVYAPLAQVPSNSGVALVRTSGDPLTIASAVRNAIHAHDPALALFAIEPLARTVSGSVAQERFTTLLLSLFALLAIVLSAIGVYGLLSYLVAQRTTELGIRLALGAEPRGLMRMIVAHAARLATAGVLLGVAGALAGARLLRGLLFGIAATDPRALATAAALIFLVALAASLPPARRAVGVEPLRSLRVE